jgi:acyl carrier protein
MSNQDAYQSSISIDRITQMALKTLRALGEELGIEGLDAPDENMILLGGRGVLDSLQLVSFIADLEQVISDEFNQNVVLADERAMSRSHSPFRSVSLLAKYIKELLEEEG